VDGNIDGILGNGRNRRNERGEMKRGRERERQEERKGIKGFWMVWLYFKNVFTSAIVYFFFELREGGYGNNGEENVRWDVKTYDGK